MDICDEEEEEEQNSFVVPDDDEDEDDLGSFAELSDIELAREEEEAVIDREFTRYMLPILHIIDALCSQAPYYINYMCVMYDDKNGRERGLKRLLYFCNNGNAAFMSNLMLLYRLVLVRDECQLNAATYETLCKCFDDNTHQGHEPQQQEDAATVQDRFRKLDILLGFLSMAENSINYEYTEDVRNIALEYNVELAEAPAVQRRAQEGVQPYFLFYEFCQKEGNTIRNKRECAGYATHADFPALRLLRLMWRTRGDVGEARNLYENECSADHDLDMDAMHHLLTL